MMDEKFTSGVSEEDDSQKSKPPTTFLSALDGNDTLRTLCCWSHDGCLSTTENKVYIVQHKVKQQQLTLMDMWKK
jgi:hypothetical protein